MNIVTVLRCTKWFWFFEQCFLILQQKLGDNRTFSEHVQHYIIQNDKSGKQWTNKQKTFFPLKVFRKVNKPRGAYFLSVDFMDDAYSWFIKSLL